MSTALGGFDAGHQLDLALLRDILMAADRSAVAAEQCNVVAPWPLTFEAHIDGTRYLCKRERLAAEDVSIEALDCPRHLPWAQAYQDEFFVGHGHLSVRVRGEAHTDAGSDTVPFEITLAFFGRTARETETGPDGSLVLRVTKDLGLPDFPVNNEGRSWAGPVRVRFANFHLPGDLVRLEGSRPGIFDGPPLRPRPGREILDGQGRRYVVSGTREAPHLDDENGKTVAQPFTDLLVPALDLAGVRDAAWAGQSLGETAKAELARTLRFPEQEEPPDTPRLTAFGLRLPIAFLPLLDDEARRQAIIANLDHVIFGVEVRDIVAGVLGVDPEEVPDHIPEPPIGLFVDYFFRFDPELEVATAGVVLGLVKAEVWPPQFLFELGQGGERSLAEAGEQLEHDSERPSALAGLSTGLSSELLAPMLSEELDKQVAGLDQLEDINISASMVEDSLRFTEQGLVVELAGSGSRPYEIVRQKLYDIRFSFTMLLRLVPRLVRSVSFSLDNGVVQLLDCTGAPISFPEGQQPNPFDGIEPTDHRAADVCFHSYCDSAIGQCPPKRDMPAASLKSRSECSPGCSSAYELQRHSQLQSIMMATFGVELDDVDVRLTPGSIALILGTALVALALGGAALALAGVTAGLTAGLAAAVGSAGALALILAVTLGVSLARAFRRPSGTGIGEGLGKLAHHSALLLEHQGARAWAEVYPRTIQVTPNGFFLWSRSFPRLNVVGEIACAVREAPCFIASAVLGPRAPELAMLRRFRDQYLMANRWGRTLVRVYYRIGPRIAPRVSRDGGLQRLLAWLVRKVAAWVEGVSHG